MRETEKRQAFHDAIELLVARAVTATRPSNPEGYACTVRADKATRHHATARLLFAERSGLDACTLADLLEPPVATEPEPPNPSATLQVWEGPERDPADGELIDGIDAARPHLQRAREALAGTRKPPMGPPPVPTRGRVA